MQTHVVPSPTLPQPPRTRGLSAAWVLLQKLQQQQVVRQQQLEKQLQLLQQQMLLPGRGPGEGVPAEPRLSQGSAVQPSQSSGPSARPEDLANGMASTDPAVPAAAEGVCRWERVRCVGISTDVVTQSRSRCPTDEAAAQLWWEEMQELPLDKYGHKSDCKSNSAEGRAGWLKNRVSFVLD